MTEFYREEAVYRYAVRCDRATHFSIRRAAAKAGLTEQAFVQAHFETILSARPTKPAPDAPKADAADAAALAGRPRGDDDRRAADLGIHEQALRLWRVASVVAGPDDVFLGDAVAMGRAAHVPPATVARALSLLSTRRLVQRETCSRGPEKARWRLLKREE